MIIIMSDVEDVMSCSLMDEVVEVVDWKAISFVMVLSWLLCKILKMYWIMFLMYKVFVSMNFVLMVVVIIF